MNPLQSLLLLTLVGSSSALPSQKRGSHVLHEKRNSFGAWRKTTRVDANAIIPLRIGLTQTNLHTGYDRLMEVSHPSSEQYGKFLSPEAVHDLFQPSEDAVTAVKEWLASEGVDADAIVHSENKGWLAIDLPAHHVENLFKTVYHVHEHPHKELAAVGCDEYSLPAHLSEHIDYIRPGVKMSSPIKKRLDGTKTKRSDGDTQPHWGRRPGRPHHGHWPHPPHHSGLPADLQNCGVNITPPCIRALYNIPPGHLATPGYELGLFEQGSYYDAGDINKFFENFAPWVPKGTLPELVSVDGGEAPIHCHNSATCGEADIDIVLGTALIYPQKVINYQVDDKYWGPKEIAKDNLFNTFLDALDGSYCTYSAYGITGDSPGIDPKYPDPHKKGYKGELQCGVYTPTKVISASYGESEEDLPINYAKRQCNEFMKLGLQGHSIFTSSGDYGVGIFPGDPPPNGCLSNLAEGMNGTIFNPDYPGDCPYITTVGATMLPRNGTIYDAEEVMDTPEVAPHFTSGGGFSNFYDVPKYQKKAVAEYFANHDPG